MIDLSDLKMSNETIEVQGWKGQGEVEIAEQKDQFIIREWRKNKETGETYFDEHTTDKEITRALYRMICSACDVQVQYEYRFLVHRWCERNKTNEKYALTMEQMVETFNGGKFRKLEYFPFYYSLKVLEAKGIIGYFGRGGIILINKNTEL